MKNKKTAMGLAALMILVFHFYIPFSGNVIELSIQKASYIGVDIFFLLSGLSLGQREKVEYGAFIRNRLTGVYLPFVCYVGIYTLYKGISGVRFFKIICFAEFFEKGGGSFLWFIPALMILYLLSPLFLIIKQKLGGKGVAVLLCLWLVLVIVLQFGVKYTSIFILVNRLPIYILGLYGGCYFNESLDRSPKLRADESLDKSSGESLEKKPDERREKSLNLGRGLVIMISFVVGALLIFKFGALVKLSKPIADAFYIVAIPFVVTTVLIIGYISEKLPKLAVPFDLMGRVSLELYCLQMIFGYDIEQYIMKLTGNNPFSFLITIFILLEMSFAIDIFKKCFKKVYCGNKERKE